GRAIGQSSSVAAVALLAPLVATVVVAEGFPESWLVLRLQPDATNPLGALPEIPCRDHQARRPAVLGCERRSVVLVRHESLPVQHVCKRKVGGVSAIGPGDHEGGALVELDPLQE